MDSLCTGSHDLQPWRDPNHADALIDAAGLF